MAPPIGSRTGRILKTFKAVIVLATMAIHMAATAVNIPVPAPPVLGASSFLLLDYDSGQVLASNQPDLEVEPASITKLMTSYVVFHELAKGNLKLDELVRVSENAWRTPGSRMFIEVNSQVKVEDLLKGLIIQSGNDACVALAEHIAGSELVFAGMMNEYAKLLGLQHTQFINSTGLPADGHYTSAKDMALLSAAMIREFPDLYQWYALKEYTFNEIRQHNRNTLLWRDPAVDGLKTGHTEAAGYCLAASARRGGMRLISVLMGAASEKARADETQKLLNYGFRFFETHRVYEAGQKLEQVQVWKGATDKISLGIAEDLWVTIPRGQYANLEAKMDVLSVLTAPIEAQATLGQLNVTLGEEVLATVPLLALDAVDEGGFWTRFGDTLSLWFSDLTSDDEN
jgi:D-alanyl-D-alanine carboxypeptidase (penicillin-binding protein 5/6)